MKKILGVSFAAILAVSPMLAKADPVYTSAPTAGTPQATVNQGPTYQLVDETATANVASTSYVKGAYNAAIKAVNAENARATGVEGNLESLNTGITDKSSLVGAINSVYTAATTEDGVQAVATGTTDAGSISVTDAEGNTTDVVIKDITTSNIEDNSIRTSTEQIRAAASASDTELTTEKAVATAIESAVGNINTDLDNYATKSGAVVTLNNSGTVVYTTWGEDATDVAAGTVQLDEGNTYYSAYNGEPEEVQTTGANILPPRRDPQDNGEGE